MKLSHCSDFLLINSNLLRKYLIEDMKARMSQFMRNAKFN